VDGAVIAPLTIAEAEALIRAQTKRAVRVRAVRDVSMRAVVLQQWIERRTIETIPTKPAPTLDRPRDLWSELWSLELEAPAPYNEAVRLVTDANTGAVRACPACAGSGKRVCSACGGSTSVACRTCGGTGDGPWYGAERERCSTCGGISSVHCTHCTLGALDCDTCDLRGETFSVQRARVQWMQQSHRAALSAAPKGVEVELDKMRKERSFDFDRGAFRVVQTGVIEHFRAAPTHDEGDASAALAQLAKQHAPQMHERIVAQRGWVERYEAWEITVDASGAAITVYATGPDRVIADASALSTGPGPAVAMVAVGLGVAAILAASVLR
jgi:hypothetical protein